MPARLQSVAKSFSIVPAKAEEHLKGIFRLEKEVFEEPVRKWELEWYLKKQKFGQHYVLLEENGSENRDKRVIGYILAERKTVTQFQRFTSRKARLGPISARTPMSPRFLVLDENVEKKTAKPASFTERSKRLGIRVPRRASTCSKKLPPTKHSYYSVGNFAVAKDYQRGGFGTVLFEYFLRQVEKQRVVREIRLETCREWPHVCRFYERHGFRAFGRLKNYYGKGKDGVRYSRWW
eukprot:g4463.t1